jgi:hypothetical protein
MTDVDTTDTAEPADGTSITDAPITTDDTAPAHPGYIRLQIDMSFDARSHGYFAKAPDEWVDWTPQQREQFLNDAAQEYLDEQIQAHATFYATAEEASSANQSSWGVSFDEDYVEEIF